MKQRLIGITSLCLLATLQASRTSLASSGFVNEADAGIGGYRTQANYNPGFWLATGPTAAGYGLVPFPALEWLEFTARLAVSATSDNSMNPGGLGVSLTVGPTFNFATDERGITSAIFVTVGCGFNYEYQNSFAVPTTLVTSPAQSSTGFAYDLEIGKRFPLLPYLAWKPTLSVSGFTGPDISNGDLPGLPAYSVVPLRFTVIF